MNCSKIQNYQTHNVLQPSSAEELMEASLFGMDVETPQAGSISPSGISPSSSPSNSVNLSCVNFTMADQSLCNRETKHVPCEKKQAAKIDIQAERVRLTTALDAGTMDSAALYEAVEKFCVILLQQAVRDGLSDPFLIGQYILKNCPQPTTAAGLALLNGIINSSPTQNLPL